MSEQGRKYDGGKLRYDLIPVLALEDMVKGLTFGTIKYDDNNWVKVPNGRKRYLAAALRHIQEYRKGNLWDEEQNIHHLSAAMNNLSFTVEKDLRGWEDSSDEQEDISQEELETYVGNLVEYDTLPHRLVANPIEELWYPPVKEGENPWIEYDGSGQPVEDDIFVKTIVVNDRDYNHIEDHSTYKAGEIQWDWQHGCEFNIVAYKIVS